MTLVLEPVVAPAWSPVLCPEEVELADYLVGDRQNPDEPVAVYVLSLASRAAYVGVSKNPPRRVGVHARNAQLALPGPDVAEMVTYQPSEMFLALHGTPRQVVGIQTPSRRHAVILEALLTDALAHAGVHVFGSGWDQLANKWTRNEFSGETIDADALAFFVLTTLAAA
jgi:hypothetical protein